MGEVSACQMTSSSSSWLSSHIAWWPARGTLPCSENQKQPKQCCGKSSNRCLYRSNAAPRFIQARYRPRRVVSVIPNFNQFWAKADRPGVRAFLLAMASLGVALVLAFYSGAASELGRMRLATVTAVAALLVAGWVAITLVPILAKRTPLRWIGYRMEYKITREGWFYIAGIILIALA